MVFFFHAGLMWLQLHAWDLGTTFWRIDGFDSVSLMKLRKYVATTCTIALHSWLAFVEFFALNISYRSSANSHWLILSHWNGMAIIFTYVVINFKCNRPQSHLVWFHWWGVELTAWCWLEILLNFLLLLSHNRLLRFLSIQPIPWNRSQEKSLHFFLLEQCRKLWPGFCEANIWTMFEFKF